MSKTIQTVNQSMKRESTTIWINPVLWKNVRIIALQKGMTATDFCEEALQEKLTHESIATITTVREVS
jgi:hypothetical protein